MDTLTSAHAGRGWDIVQEFVFGVGVIISLLAVALLIRPAVMLGVIEEVFSGRWLYLVALVRFLTGAGLIAAAPAVTFQTAVATLGWLFALGGLLLVSLPVAFVRQVVAWFIALPVWQVRLWVLLAVALGFFLVYTAASA